MIDKLATRHMEMLYHFCRQHTELGNVRSVFKPATKHTREMVADFMNKQTIRETYTHHALRSFGKQDIQIELAPIPTASWLAS